MGIHLKRVPTAHVSLTAFCDADWGSATDDRRSTSGACIFLGGNLFSWWAQKQPVIISRSSTEAEYRALALATTELLWLQSLLFELGVPFSTPTVLCDNMSTIALAYNPVLHARTKHMELDLFFLCEKALHSQLKVSLARTNVQTL